MGCVGSTVPAPYLVGSTVPAPYLIEYFQVLGEMMQIAESADPMEVLRNDGLVEELEEQAETIKAKLPPIIEQSFDHHDIKKKGILDQEEARIFCEHYVELFLKFHEERQIKLVKTQAQASKSSQRGVATLMSMMLGALDDPPLMGGDGAEMTEEQMKEQPKFSEQAVTKRVQAQRDDYKANKAERDEAAFKFLDVSGDGKVQKRDVVRALTLDTQMYDDVHEALGLIPEENGLVALVWASHACAEDFDGRNYSHCA